MAGIAEAVLACHNAPLVRGVLAPHDIAELGCRDSLTAADVENAPHGRILTEHKDVGVNDIVDIDIVADGAAVFVEDGRRT